MLSHAPASLQSVAAFEGWWILQGRFGYQNKERQRDNPFSQLRKCTSRNGGYLHSRIDSAFVLSPQNVQLQGAALPNSPKFTANATWSHNFKLGGVLVTPSASVRYSDSYYVLLPLSAQSLQDAWTEFDASLTIAPEGSGLSLTGFIRNAGNRVVKSNFIGNRLSLQSPRTFGVTASAKF
jgi:iron complex outermembrane recepter protein